MDMVSFSGSADMRVTSSAPPDHGMRAMRRTLGSVLPGASISRMRYSECPGSNGNTMSYACDRNGKLITTTKPLAQTSKRYDHGATIAPGIQDQFGRKQIGMATLSVVALPFGPAPGASVIGDMFNSMQGNALTQGIGTLTMLQDQFGWTSVAAGVGPDMGHEGGTRHGTRLRDRLDHAALHGVRVRGATRQPPTRSRRHSR